MVGRIIVGANLGDEGKGTVVASYTKKAQGPVLNVLTNGGAQRAHSILTENGNFTFQHFGSGTYHGADSYFSEHFILNPMQFVKEYNELKGRNVTIKKPYRDPQCRWSTPYDMMANQIKEELRKHDKHGSCGMGIWETVQRYNRMLCIPFDTFLSLGYYGQVAYLTRVKAYYEREITIPDTWKSIWNGEHLMDHFIEDCKFMGSHTTTIIDISNYDEVIFENGQGLMLCDTGADVAGTTPSYTDSRDAIGMLSKFGLDDVTVHYVTRPYLTRHGKGYLDKETLRNHISSDIEADRTNHYNIFQDDFRYGILDLGELKTRINSDVHSFKRQIELTHCDEMDRVSEFKQLFETINTYESALV